VDPTTIAPFVSALSVMLAAYGFFYNAYKGRVEEGQDADEAPQHLGTWETELKKVKRARNAALLLALVPLAVWLLLLDAIEDELDAAFAADWAIRRYATLDVIFVVLANGWLLISIGIGVQWVRLVGKRRRLSARRPREG
jgi:hypothetical protein